MKRFLLIKLALFSLIAISCSHTGPYSDYAGKYTKVTRTIASEELTAPWAYDPGPNPNDPMGKELIDIVASQPHMPSISKTVTGEQLFRPAFGPTLWLMIPKPNSVKILFIGQDGTHIAEAAGRTATAGFGGRGQDLAAYFGVNTGAAFINAFAFTIRGQYSVFGVPIVENREGNLSVRFGSVTENGTWMMAQDQNSPMVKWRNSLIDWIIRNNKDSLKMVVLFGGSAQDAIGAFVESRGGKVGAQYTEQDLVTKGIKIPKFRVESAGANFETPTLIDKDGKDLYAKLLGKRMNYKKDENKDSPDVIAAQKALRERINEIRNDIVFTNTGVGGSGVMHPAQIGGYDLGKIEIGGQRTISLKGLKLSDGSVINQDVLVAEFPHPTALSMMTPPAASQRIASSLTRVAPFAKKGWRIDPDPGMTNEYAAGREYRYGRSDIGPAYYDFGTPKNRMVSVSSASRMSGKPNVVVIGTRDKVQFDMGKITAASNVKQPDGIPSDEMFSARPRSQMTRYNFDLGPGMEMAKIMKENLDMNLIGKMKNGSAPNPRAKDPEPIANFNIKTHPLAVGDFGHYRGTFRNPKVIILADPDGSDDILTSRALTGARGQYLHSLMSDFKVGDQYLVIKTVPFGMDDATEAEWATVLAQTAQYRAKIFEAVLAQGKPLAVIADGPQAAKELNRLVPASLGIPTVTISRQGSENDSGIQAAASELSKISAFSGNRVNVRLANLPRTHLGFMARVWEGTGGTHVFNAIGAGDRGSAFAVVAPLWASRAPVQQSSAELQGTDAIKSLLNRNKLSPVYSPSSFSDAEM